MAYLAFRYMLQSGNWHCKPLAWLGYCVANWCFNLLKSQETLHVTLICSIFLNATYYTRGSNQSTHTFQPIHRTLSLRPSLGNDTLHIRRQPSP